VAPFGSRTFFTTFLALALALSSSQLAHSEDPGVAFACRALLDPLENPSPSGPWKLDEYANWTFGKDRVPFHHPAQLLPPEFIAKLESQDIPVRIVTSTEVVAVLDNEMNPILSFELLRGTTPDALRIEGLEGSDPTHGNATRIKQGKSRRGLNAELFRYARDRILAVGRAAGFRALEGHGTADYLVNLLYRRTGKLAPTSEFGQVFYRKLDAAYLASSRFPAPFRISSLDEFSSALGTFKKDPPGYEEVKARLPEILAGKSADGWKTIPLGNTPGLPVAWGITTPDGRTLGPFFLWKTPAGETDILSWRALYACCMPQLILRSATEN
jgi:hypothetical protein